MMDTAGRRGSNCVTTRGRRCLRASRRLRGCSWLEPSYVGAAEGVGQRKRRSRQRKPSDREMWDCPGARDNKSVAGIGERHPPRLRVAVSFGSATARDAVALRGYPSSRDGRVAQQREEVFPSRGSIFISMMAAR